MAVKPAAFAWDTLRDLYLRVPGPREEVGLAVALAASATRDRLDALIDLLADDTHGEVRIHFLVAINRLGGARGTEILESLKDDPVFGKEATARLRRKRRRTPPT